MPALAVVGRRCRPGRTPARCGSPAARRGRCSVPPGDLRLRQRRRCRQPRRSSAGEPPAPVRVPVAGACLSRPPGAAAARPPACSPDAAGAQAASIAGSAPDWPNSSATLETTNSANPAATPLPIIRATPPRRGGRIENPAASSAIVPPAAAAPAALWKCSRWRIDEKPDRSSSRDEAGQRPDRERVRRRRSSPAPGRPSGRSAASACAVGVRQVVRA